MESATDIYDTDTIAHATQKEPCQTYYLEVSGQVAYEYRHSEPLPQTTASNY